MIKSVTATNYLGDSIKMELTRPELSGFIIENIDGLGPPPATVNITKSATDDGGRFNSAMVSERNVVLDLVFMDGLPETIEDIRHKSYKYFPIKKKVKLVIETDNRISETEGIVETNEPEIFSEREGCQISIRCADPFLYSSGARGQQITTFSGVNPMFEFPFSNESLTEPLLIMGEIENVKERVITYNGDAEIGITIVMHAIDKVENVTIYNTGTRESFFIDTSRIAEYTGSGIVAGDEITISTVKNNKGITLLRGGKTTNILNCVDMNADWFSLAKGDNIFVYTAEYGSDNLQFKIINRTVYEGA